MKLYRGMKTPEFKIFDSRLEKISKVIWTALLKRRSQGDFTFPEELAREVTVLEATNRLRRQHFTDNKAIALGYAKANGGVLIEIDVPIESIVEHFHIEFQNFGKRRKNFELVYVIDARTLALNSKRWKLKELRVPR